MEWAALVAGWEAEWSDLDPPVTMLDLISMNAAGTWPTPAHRAAYEQWAPHAAYRILEAIRAETGVDHLATPSA